MVETQHAHEEELSAQRTIRGYVSFKGGARIAEG
jgi:hypothetical protein